MVEEPTFPFTMGGGVRRVSRTPSHAMQRTDPFGVSMLREKELLDTARALETRAIGINCPMPAPTSRPCLADHTHDEYARLIVCHHLGLMARATRELAHAYHIACYDGPGYDCDRIIPRLEAYREQARNPL